MPRAGALRRAVWLTASVMIGAMRGAPHPETSSSGSAGGPRRRTHKTKDGSTFVYDEAARAWRLDDSCPACPLADAADSPPQPVLAVEGPQFAAHFEDGSFEIAGAPVLLGAPPEQRAGGEQLHGDTGRMVWDGAVALAKALEADPTRMLAGRRVLELGAGRGALGIAASRLGASHVVLTDLGYCLAAMREAVDLNRGPAAVEAAAGVASCDVEVAELDWARPEAFLRGRPPGHFDLILAADVIWLSDLVEPLAGVLAALLAHSPDAEAVIAHQTRSLRVEEEFIAAARARGLDFAWRLPGGNGGNSVSTSDTAGSGGGGMEAPPLTWHPAFRPDHRLQLWGLRPSPKRS